MYCSNIYLHHISIGSINPLSTSKIYFKLILNKLFSKNSSKNYNLKLRLNQLTNIKFFPLPPYSTPTPFHDYSPPIHTTHLQFTNFHPPIINHNPNTQVIDIKSIGKNTYMLLIYSILYKRP